MARLEVGLGVVGVWLGCASLLGCQGFDVDSGQRPTPSKPAATAAATAAAVAPQAPSEPEPEIEEVVADPLEPVGAASSGAIVLGRLREKLLALVADADERAIVVVDVDGGREVWRHALDGEPSHLLLTGDGRVVVSVASTSRVETLVMSGERLVRQSVAQVPAEPAGMAMTADGTLLVASRWGAALSMLDGATLAVKRQVKLSRDPYAVAMFEDGRQALVTHVVGGRVSVVDVQDGAMRELDASRMDRKEAFPNMMPMAPMSFGGSRVAKKLPVSVRAHRFAVQAFAAARADDGRILVAATLADGSRAPSSSGYGGGASDIRTQAGVELVVDAEGLEVSVPRGTARGTTSDCFLPRGAAWDAGEGLLLLACAGTDRIVAVEVRGKPRGMVRHVFDVPAGPAGVAIDPVTRRWVAWSQFAGAVSAGPLLSRAPFVEKTVPQVISIARHAPLPASVARGRALFHEAGGKRRVSFDGRACASCHPSGRDDGMTWATSEGPRQTPMLMGRITDTAPFGWNGRMPDLDEHLQRTITRLGGIGITSEQRADLVAYLRHMQPPASGSAEDDRIARGQALFTDDNRCSSCHPLGSQTTDGEAHDLGHHDAFDRVRTFDTPTLRFVARSAPYFHDGRYTSLDELLADPATGMGTHADLDTEDRAALAAFLATL